MPAQLEKLVKVLSLLPLLTALVYWTGRWYTEWYFNQFSTSYHAMRFDMYYYLHASWNTVLTAICFLIILSYVGLTLYIFPKWYWLAFASVVMLISIAILTLWPFRFDPYSPFFRKLLGAREFSLQGIGWVSLFATLVLAYQYRQKLTPVLSDLSPVIQQHFFAIVVLLLILAWVYLALVGYLLGIYHGQSAIWKGRMGVKWVEVEGIWWILVTRTDDGRNLVYDREQGVGRFVSDDQIKQINGFVTGMPKK